MDTVTKNKIVDLEKEINILEERMLKAFDSGAGTYNNLKNEQWSKVNELKKLKSRISSSNLIEK